MHRQPMGKASRKHALHWPHIRLMKVRLWLGFTEEAQSHIPCKAISILTTLDTVDTKTHSDTTVARMLVGNKCDLDNIRDVSVEEGKSLAEAEGLFFIETSALDSTNVRGAFEIVIREIYSNVSRKVLNSDSYKAELSVNRVITSAEKSKEAAVGAQAQLEGKVVELEAVIAVMAAERSTLEIPIPSKSLSLKTASTPTTPLSKISPSTSITNKILETEVANKTVHAEECGNPKIEDAEEVVKEVPISQDIGATFAFPPRDDLDKTVNPTSEIPPCNES
ncbi:hypothetical protein TEA_005523 [Camellia sinensis var. sinensis]|uniref:Uncharacterized protein n=1 Tax=Camellia sinensis var. sinensis TaxID=542762 RepID=A0A4S4DKX9_CAMSN|nr:hypothetical protein TEA_005523 [Camellia sinensis var. sinensis]